MIKYTIEIEVPNPSFDSIIKKILEEACDSIDALDGPTVWALNEEEIPMPFGGHEKRLGLFIIEQTAKEASIVGTPDSLYILGEALQTKAKLGDSLQSTLQGHGPQSIHLKLLEE